MDITAIKDLYPFASHYFPIKNHRYHYLDEGKGEPIVMLHGNPSWSFLFRNLIKEFRQTHRVIAPDHLGCGLSDKPGDFPYRLETHIDNLEAMLLALGLKNITLLLHDWGGPIGMGFAIRHPELIKRLIITNTAAFSMHWIPRRIALGKIPWLGRKMIMDWNWFVSASLSMTVEKPLSSAVKCAYRLPYANKADRIAVYRFVEDIPMDPEDPSYEVLLGVEHGLWMFRETPVCIIWGMKDWCFNQRFLDRWLDIFPECQLLKLSDAGHYLFEDANDEILPFIQNFLTDNQP